MFDRYQVMTNVQMRDYTTLKLGGPADWLGLPASGEEVSGMLKEAKENDIPVTILGHGSNVLVLDGGIRGLVIRMGRSEEHTSELQSRI